MVLSSVLGADVLLFLVIGLLGGAHCIGMCGPLVTIYASNMNPPRADGGTATPTRRGRETHLTLYEVRQHALFNVGRTLSYTLIGVLMGTIGALFVIGAEEVLAATELVTGHSVSSSVQSSSSSERTTLVVEPQSGSTSPGVVA